MIRELTSLLILLAVGCNGIRDPDAIDLETALKNTKKGEYTLIVISETAMLVFFQKSWDNKKQYYFKDTDRIAVLKKVAQTINQARKEGHSIGTMGLDKYIEEWEADGEEQ